MNKSKKGLKREFVDLVKQHPISGLYSLRKTFWIAVPLISSLMVLRWIPLLPEAFSINSPMISVAERSLSFIAIVLLASWIVGMIYHSLRKRSYFYGIEEGQLVIGRGILVKERGFFQLSRITEVYLDRTLVDVLFGLYTLKVSTPTAVSDKFARIDGLNEETAKAMQHHLSLILEENFGVEVKDTRFFVHKFPRISEFSGEYRVAANMA